MMIDDIKMSLVKRLHNMHTFIPFIYFELNSGFFLRKAKFIFIYFISSCSFKECYNAMLHKQAHSSSKQQKTFSIL